LSNDIFALPNNQEYHSSKIILFYHFSKITILSKVFLDLSNELEYGQNNVKLFVPCIGGAGANIFLKRADKC
jgi:hypothetical protein